MVVFLYPFRFSFSHVSFHIVGLGVHNLFNLVHAKWSHLFMLWRLLFFWRCDINPIIFSFMRRSFLPFLIITYILFSFTAIWGFYKIIFENIFRSRKIIDFFTWEKGVIFDVKWTIWKAIYLKGSKNLRNASYRFSYYVNQFGKCSVEKGLSYI